MGTVVRRVPANWAHPRDESGAYVHMRDGRDYHWDRSDAACFGDPTPAPEQYAPDWPDEQRTHLQMYEDTTAGTPVSPVLPSPESLAAHLAVSGATSWGTQRDDYETWLRRILWSVGAEKRCALMSGGAEA